MYAHSLKTLVRLATGALVLSALIASAAVAADPIKVGLSIGLTGSNAPNGKPLLTALEIWRDDVNAAGGLLGRPVELVYYDDQTSPPVVGSVYTKLISVDQVDLLLGPLGTNQITAALPVLAQRNLTTVGILGTAANHEVQYENYFSMISLGQDAVRELSRGFFEVAAAQNPKPLTVALVGADAEFGKNATDGARMNAEAAGIEVVYDQLYPPSSTDLTPVVRTINSLNPDLVYVASYPTDTVLFVRAAAEAGLKPKMIGGAMIGMVATPLKLQMGSLMNGYVNSADMFVPVPSFNFPGVEKLLAEYQKRASGQGFDPFGYNIVPWTYAAAQVLAAAVEGTQSLDHDTIADYMREQAFSTVVGEVEFGENGEWEKPRSILTQWRGITDDPTVEQLNDPANWAIVWPPEYKSADVIFPYTEL
jgi:branched-chain amino acid transport system substrate-binding protein